MGYEGERMMSRRRGGRLERETDMGEIVDAELHVRLYSAAVESSNTGWRGIAGPLVVLYNSCGMGTISICLSVSSSTGTSSLTVPLDFEVQMVG